MLYYWCRVLLPLWCAATGSIAFETEVLLPCPRGRPWLVVRPKPAPVQLAGHLSLVLCDEAENDTKTSMAIQQPLTH